MEHTAHVADRGTCYRCGADVLLPHRVCDVCRKPEGAAEKQIERGAPLTFREKQVISLVATGMLNKEIAAQLALAEATVKEHVQRLFLKVGARNRVELAVWFVRQEMRRDG